ncbi:MAG: YwqG family protein [Vulcanimicrobiota bacterium]
MQLPALLEPYRKAIAATVRPHIALDPLPGSVPAPWSSRIGGPPYLPLEAEYPQGPDGPLYLLAQINFSETPRLDGFPQDGLLQFFIADDDMYGLDLDGQRKQNGFRVIYLPEVRQHDLVTDFSFLPPTDSLPVHGSYGMRFMKAEAPVSAADYRFEQLGLYTDELMEAYYELCSGDGHRLGGYPGFTQVDPREYRPALRDYELLLQIDTDDHADIMWGDAGVGNFFIKPADLARLRFDTVFYNWDCG